MFTFWAVIDTPQLYIKKGWAACTTYFKKRFPPNLETMEERKLSCNWSSQIIILYQYNFSNSETTIEE